MALVDVDSGNGNRLCYHSLPRYSKASLVGGIFSISRSGCDTSSAKIEDVTLRYEPAPAAVTGWRTTVRLGPVLDTQIIHEEARSPRQ